VAIWYRPVDGVLDAGVAGAGGGGACWEQAVIASVAATANANPIVRQFRVVFVMTKSCLKFTTANQPLVAVPASRCQAEWFLWMDSPGQMRYIFPTMRVSADIAFKDWAVVVDALGHGEQILILRKGGLREKRGEFHVDHRAFWLFPTQYHEAEHSVIASKRPALRHLAANAPANAVNIQYYAVADPVVHLTDASLLSRLQGRHVWAEPVLQQRFEFGRETGLHALIVRVYRLPQPEQLPLRESYGGCKSWVQLEQPVAGEVTPVVDDAEFARQRDEIIELVSDHACANS
jgi:hypothetical protein